jgi:hypothetical protein
LATTGWNDLEHKHTGEVNALGYSQTVLIAIEPIGIWQ